MPAGPSRPGRQAHIPSGSARRILDARRRVLELTSDVLKTTRTVSQDAVNHIYLGTIVV